MEIKHPQPTTPAPADYFTGEVKVQRLFEAPDPARAVAALVTFTAGARTAWHTHPLGQTLLITEGTAWVQREGSPIEIAQTGDTVWFPPGEKHWHGATPTASMTHIAIQERLEGSTVTWLEPVSESQYKLRP
jgi:quercetin dioxygenase-like cupin family protein